MALELVNINPTPFTFGRKTTTFIDLNLAAWNTASGTGNHTVFVVTGLVAMRLISRVTESATSGGAATLALGDEDTEDSIISATAVAELAEGNLWGLNAANLAVLAGSSAGFIEYINNGKKIITHVDTAAFTAGGIYVDCWWKPLTPGAIVTAGDGSAP